MEGALRFTFPVSGWEVIKYDDSKFYRNHLCKLAGTKSVDFIASQRKKTLLFIEVKNFRMHDTTVNKRERASGAENLYTEVALKFRDTVAGLALAYKKNAQELAPFFAGMKHDSKIKWQVVFVLEKKPVDRKLSNKKRDQQNRANEFRRKIKNLTANVVSRAEVLSVKGVQSKHYPWSVAYDDRPS